MFFLKQMLLFTLAIAKATKFGIFRDFSNGILSRVKTIIGNQLTLPSLTPYTLLTLDPPFTFNF